MRGARGAEEIVWVYEKAAMLPHVGGRKEIVEGAVLVSLRKGSLVTHTSGFPRSVRIVFADVHGRLERRAYEESLAA